MKLSEFWTNMDYESVLDMPEFWRAIWCLGRLGI